MQTLPSRPLKAYFGSFLFSDLNTDSLHLSGRKSGGPGRLSSCTSTAECGHIELSVSPTEGGKVLLLHLQYVDMFIMR